MPAVSPTHLALAGTVASGQARHADSAARAERYNSLAAKMAACQQGAGPTPTLAEFEQWKEDAAFERAIGRLLAKALLPR